MTTSEADVDRGNERGSEAGPRRPARPWLRDLIGVTLVLVVIVIGYAEIPFGGKTFSSSSFVSGARLCDSQTTNGLCHGPAYDDPRVDLGASAWGLEPWVQVVHHEVAEHEVPLWNRYQGIGTPLAANMQSSVFDPLYLAAHLHPTPLVQDLSLLLGLLLIGAATYFAARMLRLGPPAAVLAGVVFGLSGWFFTYSNNEWFRVYLYLPLLLGLAEWVVRSPRRHPVALLAFAVTGMFLVGMPEPTFMALVAVGAFCAVRIFVGDRSGAWWLAAARLAGGAAIGLALAGPLLMVFREYLPLSFNTHEGLENLPPATDSPTVFLNWMMPRISPTPGGLYSYTRNWVGAGAMFLAFLSFTTSRAAKLRHAFWPLLAVGALLSVQIYGGGLVSWTRHVPVWSQALWPAFGTPIIALVIALLAGLGVQTIAEGKVRAVHVVIALGALAVATVLAVVATGADLAFTHDVNTYGGWPAAVVAVLAIVIVLCLPTLRRHSAVVVVAIVIAEVLVIAPRGFYGPREDPYPTTALTTFLSDHTGDDSRIFSTDGVLFPDTAGVYGLSDPRMLDALYVDRYWDYLRSFVSRAIADRLTATGPAEGAPNVASNQMFDLLGVRYLLYRDDLGTGPPDWSGDQYRKVFRSNGVTVYENTHVAPRAFVAPQVERVPDQQAARQALIGGENVYFPDGATQIRNKDPRQFAVVESDTPVKSGATFCTEPPESAKVMEMSSDRVEIDVDSRCGGMLVLTDGYYPGWKATVDGKDATVHPADVAFRGVSVPAGRSRVVFSYEPSSFRTGLVLFAAGVVAMLVLLVTGVLAWRRKRDGAHPATSDDDAVAVPSS